MYQDFFASIFVWLNVLLCAIVQIVGESLPISSSGHFELLRRIIYSYYPDLLEIVNMAWLYDALQIFSAGIFLVYFFKIWWKLIVDKPMKFASLCNVQVWTKNILPVFVFGVVADSITFLFWYYDIAHTIEFSLTIGFMITAAALWSTQFAQEKQGINIWSLPYGFIVGTVQGLALFPGISRFGTTFTALQWLGYQRRIAFAVSFLLQWPLLVGMSIKSIAIPMVLFLKAWSMNEFFNNCQILLLIGVAFCMLAALPTIIAAASFNYVGKMIDKNRLWKFSYYMIVPMSLSLIF